MKLKSALTGLMTLLLVGCSTAPLTQQTRASNPPSVCLEVCSPLPKYLGDSRAWMLDVTELYTACAVQQGLCRHDLLKGAP